MTVATPLTHSSPALIAAVATMRRGTAFLGNGLANAGGKTVAGRYRARLTGNGLRELDRFLNLLIDAATEAEGGTAQPLQANTATKYRAIAPGGRSGRADHLRLLALGRSRACLFYCDGVARRPDRRGGSTMTIGWPGEDGRLETRRLGETVVPTAANLSSIARFYSRLADAIVAA